MLSNSLVPRTAALSGLVDQFFDDSLYGRRGDRSTGRAWLPAVDLSQNEQAFTVRVDLPGLKKEDVNVTLEDTTLTLSGERSFDNQDNAETFTRVERAYGTFSRSFTLPTNADPTAVNATFEDGVLAVSIPKREEAKSRQIEIG